MPFGSPIQVSPPPTHHFGFVSFLTDRSSYQAESIFSAVATSFAIHFGLYPVFLVPSICLILYQTTRPKNVSTSPPPGITASTSTKIKCCCSSVTNPKRETLPPVHPYSHLRNHPHTSPNRDPHCQQLLNGQLEFPGPGLGRNVLVFDPNPSSKI